MSNLIRRMSGRLERAPEAPAAVVTPPPDPRQVGLRDAVMAGFYRGATGEVFAGVPVGADDVVVDVGCGEGAALGFCAQQGAAIIGVDVQQDTLDAAKALVAGKPARSAEFHHSRAEALPLPDAVATRVLCMEVLEHVDDPRAVLAEMARIGAPGALYLITVPDARGEELMRLAGPDEYFQPPNHIRIIGRDEFAQWVSEAGLEIVSHTFNGFFWVLWFALFWNRGEVPDAPRDPVLKHWTIAWNALLDGDDGPAIKRKFDEFMPKSQIIVARRP